MDTNSIILVEGPGDVWRLEEAGIKNSVAIFGVDLTEEQLVLLGSSWCTNVIICMDNDEAGIKASENLSKTLRRMYKLYFPKLIQKDLGESSVEEVKKLFSPILNSIKESI
jgi:DNA primase